MLEMMNADEELGSLLKTAGMFDVHRWSDYPEIKAIVDDLFQEIIQYRKQRNPKSRVRGDIKIKKHLRILLIDLYVSSRGLNPWRSISKRKGAYKNEVSRYRKIFLRYDYLIPLVDDLVDLRYIEEKIGYYDAAKGTGKQTRIKATAKLIQMIESAKFGLIEALKAKETLIYSQF